MGSGSSAPLSRWRGSAKFAAWCRRCSTTGDLPGRNSSSVLSQPNNTGLSARIANAISAGVKFRPEVVSMILFTLRCAHGHEFEGWFRDGDGFEAQQKAGEIACPECRDTSVEKAVMAPRLGRSRETVPPMSPAQFRAALVEMRRQIETNCDYVGNRFAEEARR